MHSRRSVSPMYVPGLCALAFAPLLIPTGVANAGIVAASGPVILGAPVDGSVQLGSSENNLVSRAFDERQSLVLTTGLELNITASGTSAATSLSPGLVPAGTTIHSHFLHADPVDSTPRIFEGTLTFDRPILGLIVTTVRLNATDSLLGLPGITYENASGGRGAEGSDRFTISADRLRLEFRFSTSSSTDNIRIITLPTPGASAVLLGLLPLARRRRRAN